MGVFSLISNSANLRQSMMPMKLKPGGANAYKENSPAVGEGTPCQFFSFKESRRDEGAAGGFGLINICPSSFKQFMNSDIGHKLLYNYTKSKGITQESINANAVFDNLPTLQIREYAIDSELDQLVNLFRDLVNVFNPGDKNAPNNSVNADSTKKQPAEGAAVSESKNIADKIKNIWKSLADKLNDPGWYEKIYGNSVTKYTKNINHQAKEKVVRFPFAVYYRLLSCVTTNMYEVPIHPDIIIESKSEGFEGAEPYGVSFPGQGAIGSIPIIGKVISRIMSSISINTSPVWDPSKTSNTGQTVGCKFKLFNDTVDAAVNNYIFVQTLAANNMWYNYSIFKRAPALYDIKVNGVIRYFMCTANVTVKPTGPVRKVHKSLINKIFQTVSNDDADRLRSQNIEKEQKAQKEIDDIDKQIAQLEDEKASLESAADFYEEESSYLDPADPDYDAMTEAYQDQVNGYRDEAEAKDQEIQKLKAQRDQKQKKLNSDTSSHIKQENTMSSAMANEAIENEYIAIPDIYDVELQFTSMLPNNFNNFLYNYAGNPDIMRSDKGYQSNVVVKFIEALKEIVTV